MRIIGSYGAIVSWHFRVGRVILVVVVAGGLRLEGGRAAPTHLGLESLRHGRTPIVFANEGGATLVDAHCFSQIAQLTTRVVCTRVVSSSRAEQLLPVVVMVSCVEVVSVEPSVTRCCCLRIDTMTAFWADRAMGTG